MLIIDAHEDIAWNMLTYHRDYTRSALETRQFEAEHPRTFPSEDTLLGYPEWLRGRVATVFASIFAAPERAVEWGENQVYTTVRQAQKLYHAQIDVYERLANDHPDHFQLIYTRPELTGLIDQWRKLPAPAKAGSAGAEGDNREEIEKERQATRRNGHGAANAGDDEQSTAENASPAGPPLGLCISMEGAECIREPAEVEAWWERGVRIIGPAWRSNQYTGGTSEPGPLTADGFELLEHMAGLNAGLDLTHMDEEAVLQALDFYTGPLLASHCNVKALLKDVETNRHLSDRVIQGIIERGGVIGIVPFIAFLKTGWKRGDRRDEGRLEQIVAHIDYVCQIAGDAQHAGLGTDFDGGFGLQSVPPGIGTIADLHKLAPLLSERGYTDADIAAVFGENWLKLLQRILPESI